MGCVGCCVEQGASSATLCAAAHRKWRGCGLVKCGSRLWHRGRHWPQPGCIAEGAACGRLQLKISAERHSILTSALLRLLAFLESGTFAPSRWDMQDSGHVAAALPICRLGPRQFGHRTRRLQSGGLRGAFLPGFRKTPWRGADCPA